MATATATLNVLNPVAAQDTRVFPPAKRRESLNDITLGLAWNGKSGGNTALEKFAELVAGRYQNVKVLKLYDDIPLGPDTIELGKARCQAVIAATAD